MKRFRITDGLEGILHTNLKPTELVGVIGKLPEGNYRIQDICSGRALAFSKEKDDSVTLRKGTVPIDKLIRTMTAY